MCDYAVKYMAPGVLPTTYIMNILGAQPYAVIEDKQWHQWLVPQDTIPVQTL